MGEREDFVQVQLTAAGAARGGLRVVGPTYDFEFVPGAPLEIPRREAAARLGDELASGLLEIVGE